MNPEGDPRTGDEPGPGMSEKVVRVHGALDKHNIPHAFGGAIAVDYYRVPRATIDIDLNVFVSAADSDKVIEALGEEFPLNNSEELSQEIAERDQGKTYWGETRIDLFFSALAFHDSVAERVRKVDYQDATIPILSAEDIVVIKTVFDRAQDWADIEAVCALQGADLDIAYMTRWLGEIVGSLDARLARLTQLVEAASPE